MVKVTYIAITSFEECFIIIAYEFDFIWEDDFGFRTSFSFNIDSSTGFDCFNCAITDSSLNFEIIVIVAMGLATFFKMKTCQATKIHFSQTSSMAKHFATLVCFTASYEVTVINLHY